MIGIGRKKKEHTIGIWMCTVMVAVLLSGCKKTDEEILSTSLTASASIKSVEADMKVEGTISLDFQGAQQDIPVLVESDEFVFTDSGKAKMLTDVSVMGRDSQTQSYLQKEGEDYYVYTGVEDIESGEMSWTKMRLAGSDEWMQQLGMDSLQQFKDHADSFVKLEERQENDREYQLYQYTMAADEQTKVLKRYATIVQSALGKTWDTQTMIDSMAENLGDIVMTVWIDKEKEVIYKIEYPITDMMNQMSHVVQENLDEILPKEQSFFMGDMELSVSDMTVEILYKNYDKIQDFTIPEEALQTQESED